MGHRRAERIHKRSSLTSRPITQRTIISSAMSQIPGKTALDGERNSARCAYNTPAGCCPPPSPRTSAWSGPAAAAKPARVYKVDLAAIQEKGDVMSNYQIFPNDRLIVGRNEVVKKTVEIDRLAAPIQIDHGNMLQEALHAPSTSVCHRRQP